MIKIYPIRLALTWSHVDLSPSTHWRNIFTSTIIAYIYHPLTNVNTVANLLKRSSLLLAAICTTAAFSAGSDNYEACLEMFINDVSATTFSHTHSFDDVRALCIGAFWLVKKSPALSALGEMNP